MGLHQPKMAALVPQMIAYCVLHYLKIVFFRQNEPFLRPAIYHFV